jgi:hypothetical protein
VELHSEQETFRGTLTARTPDNAPTTLIVMRRNQRVWLTFDGAVVSTVSMTDPDAMQLVGLLHEAQGRAG